MSHKGNGKVPFVDLVALHQAIQTELVDVFKATLASAGFIGGPAVDGFEHAFGAYCEAKHCVGVGSGTDALRFALMAGGIRPGDIVVTVPFTFIATTEAISQAGAQPDFVDVDAQTYTLAPEQLRRYLETQCDFDPQTRRCIHRVLRRPVTAVIPVHLYGQMADMDPILELAERYNLMVIEDACQAHGAEYFSKRENRWRKAGSMGQAAAFSFYPGKNLGACGEGGAVTTNSDEIARKIRMLRDHGQSTKYYHDMEGYNGRLDALEAGILSVKLQHLTSWNNQRRESALIYDELLASMEGSVMSPSQANSSKSVYHLYVVRTPFRDQLQKHLNEAGIGTGIHYPIPIHLQVAYVARGWKRGDFPESEEASDQVLSLPMFPGLKPDQQRHVALTITQFAATCVGR